MKSVKPALDIDWSIFMIEVLPDIVSDVFLFCQLFSNKFGFQIKVIWPFFLPGKFPIFLDSKS